MVRKLYLVLMFLLSGCAFLWAHDSDKKSREELFREIQEFKMKYLAQEMELKDDQQARFVELYGEMTAKRMAAMKAAKELERKVRKDSSPSEEDYQMVTDAMNKANTECASIEKEYDDKFAEFLSQKQIFKMKSAEKEFRKKMEEMRHSKRGKKGKR